MPKAGPFSRAKRGPRPKGKGELFPFFRRRKKIFEKGVKTLDGMRIIRYNIIDNSVSIFFYRFEFKKGPRAEGGEEMVENDQGVVASKATIARLPGYLGYLRDKQAEGVENISSTAIAEDLRLNAVQVRKDLAFVSSVAGRPKLGFAVSDLILDIERFLGYDNVTDAVLVGTGGLGRTLMGYDGFKTYGLNIEAAFDVDPDLIGRRVHGKPVFALEKLPGVVKRLNIHIGIITVPKQVAQSVADLLVGAGIKAIWNFAPTHLQLPEGIAVKNEDMAASLALLSKKLSEILKADAPHQKGA